MTQKWMNYRKHFPILTRQVHDHPFVYLDSAATSQKPDSVIEAISTFYKEHYSTVHRSVYQTAVEAGVRYQMIRQKISRFLNAASDEEIIFTRGTTDALNLVAASFGKAFIAPGDEILISEMEHHSNIVPWQLMAQERKAQLRVVPFFDNGLLDMQAFHALLSAKTKIVSITHASNTLGTINPIKEIVDAAHAVGAKVCVDGAQSVPHMPIDVRALGCDFFAFSGHKVVGPTGIGCLYGKKELLDQMPPYQGGGDMIDTVTFAKTTYAQAPLKFEAGTPMIAEVIGLGAAIDFLSGIGMAEIEAWERALLDELWHCLSNMPAVKILGEKNQRTSLVSFTIDGVHPLDIATLLDLQGIACRSGHLCAQPVMSHFGCSAATRVSLAFYNTKEEVHYFCDCLQQVISQLS